MIPLFVQRDVIFKSFDNQILVTRELHTAKRILLIIHDPPEVVAQPDPLDNSLDAHNAWVTDSVLPYITWAIKQGFGVVDINVPRYITQPEDNDTFTPRPDEKGLQQQMQDLVCYLWDNYLQTYRGIEDLFLMGVGNAYLGVKVLLINRDVKRQVAGVVNFVDGNLRPVRSDVDQELSSWYKENSRVYVSNDHACWEDESLARKVARRRFGSVIRSEVSGLPRMMTKYKDDVQQWFLDRMSQERGETTEDDKMV